MGTCEPENRGMQSDPEVARAYFETLRWPDGVACPHCGLIGAAGRIQPRRSAASRNPRSGLWKCSGCQCQFTVTVGTVLENSKIPIHKWLRGMHLICLDRKGVSCQSLQRELGISSKTARAMSHRIRYALQFDPLRSAWATSARQHAIQLAAAGHANPLELERIKEILASTRRPVREAWATEVSGANGCDGPRLSLWPLPPHRAISALLSVPRHSMLNW